jgi:hypothetical protein
MVETLIAVTVVFVVGLVGTLGAALRQGNGAATINAVIAIAVALLPLAIEGVVGQAYGFSPGFGPELGLWLAVAGFLHSLGMLGLYESVWWWDHLTHLISGGLVAALIYAGFLVVGQNAWRDSLEFPMIVLLTVGTTLAAGIFWELIELVARELGEIFDIEPVLVHYGWLDTGLDLLFDVIAAILVILLDIRLFVDLTEQFPQVTRTILVASSGLFLLGSVMMAVGIRLADTADLTG